MIAVCSKCHSLFETTTEDAYTPGVVCAQCHWHGECMRLARVHVDADNGDDATYMALMSSVRLWLRAQGIMASDSKVRSEADKFLLVVYAR